MNRTSGTATTVSLLLMFMASCWAVSAGSGAYLLVETGYHFARHTAFTDAGG